MKRATLSVIACAALVCAVFAGCTDPNKTTKDPVKTPEKVANTPPVKPVASLPTIRVKAGSDAELKDTKGNTWAADTGFEGGSTIDRPDLAVTGTDRPEIYKSEHYSMDSWSQKVPNGDYVVSLHFSEDYDGNADATSRVFTFAVIDGDVATGKVVKEIKDFSPWKAAGDHFKAYVEKVPVTVTKGAISIKFTPQAENPQINAIEIAPK